MSKTAFPVWTQPVIHFSKIHQNSGEISVRME
jgi:hypothetical protein